MGGIIGGLPYPTGTDKVVDGDNAIAALATAVDRNPISLVANVIQGTPGTGWTALGNGLRLIVVNGWVWQYGRMQRAGTTSTTVASFPVDLGPIETFRIQINNGILLAISGGGAITIDAGNPSTATNAQWAISYPRKGV